MTHCVPRLLLFKDKKLLKPHPQAGLSEGSFPFLGPWMLALSHPAFLWLPLGFLLHQGGETVDDATPFSLSSMNLLPQQDPDGRLLHTESLP